MIYSSFITVCVLIVIVFVTSKNYTQLAIASLLYPLLAYITLRFFPLKSRGVATNKPITIIQPVSKLKEEGEKMKEKVEIVDFDKRAFLKLIGGAGVSFFIFSILAKKIETLLPGRTTGSGVAVLKNATGSEINPAELQPTDGYKISETDNEGESSYYGFINKDGNWYVMKQDSGAGTFRYAKGKLNFPSNWISRENLKYDYFYKVFAQPQS